MEEKPLAPGLYLVATPIGNLADISLRALHALALADAIGCEDTRTSGAFLRHFGLEKPLLALHEHNERAGAAQVCARLAAGERVAYISDAGTPAVSDPGAVLVQVVAAAGHRVMPLPGASSAITALSVAGDTAAQGCGSFIMAPFANRLAGGRFAFDGRRIVLPGHHLTDGNAIHGFSRHRPWRIVDRSASSLQMSDTFAEPDNPYRYQATHTVALTAAGVSLHLVLMNQGQETLPFGAGFHPWFTKEKATFLTFAADTQFSRCASGFAERPMPMPSSGGFASGADLGRMPWFDGHFAGWRPRLATIEWRRRDLRLAIGASPALGNLHVYVPDEIPAFCVEPVTHVPDVHNRRILAGHGDLTILAPGESMEISAQLCVTAG